MTESEKNLVAGCLKGDKASWDAFVIQYSALVYHTVRKALALYNVKLSDEVIEDLFQEFFLSILRDDLKKLRQFRGDRGCSLASWLRVIAARLTIDYLRQQRPSDIEAGDSLPSDQADATTSLIAREEEQALARALQTLSARDRLIIELSYRQALTADEIASMLKTSVAAVYTQKSRLLDKLREILDKTLTL